MDDVMIIADVFLGYSIANLTTGRSPDTSGLLLLYLMTDLDFTGFFDDLTKTRKKQSLGLTSRAKILGRAFVGISFAVMVLHFRNSESRTPTTLRAPILRDTSIDPAFLGIGVEIVFFIVWANFLVTAWLNTVNFTGGLGGLAAGASMIAFGAYAAIIMWQLNQACHGVLGQTSGCYNVRDPRDLAIVCVAIVGFCLDFLWRNTSPTKVFMGSIGSLTLGDTFVDISTLTRIEVLAIPIGGLYLIEIGSVVLQMGFYKIMRKRIFRMAPLHYHPEFKGWKEVTMVVCFWITEVLPMFMAVGTFYAEWLAHQ